MENDHGKQTTSFCPPLPEKLATYIGSLNAVEIPPQGTAFQVSILSSARGRFVLKIAHTPAMVQALMKECHVLIALQQYTPFVVQPLGDAAVGEQGHVCLFTCIEGEPLYVVLNRSDTTARDHLIKQYARALRYIHDWKPALSQPVDWLTETLQWVGRNIHARAQDVEVSGTNSRFDGRNARQLFAALLAQRSLLANDLVFCHGDYCLPNILVRDAQVVGVIDWSSGGYADRRFDLATALFSMRLIQQGEKYFSTFLQAYGYSEPLHTLEYFEALHALTCAFWQ